MINPSRTTAAGLLSLYRAGAVSAEEAIGVYIERADRLDGGLNAFLHRDLKGGKKKPDAVKGFLRGQVMKQTGGKADPAVVGELLEAKLAELTG